MADIEQNEGRAKRQERNLKRRKEMIMTLSTGFTVAAVVSTFPAFFSIAGKDSWLDLPLRETVALNEDYKNRVSQLQLEVARLKSDLSHLNVIIADSGPSTSASVATANFERRIAEVEKKQATLDRIILDNPQKALELPLLKRDVDAVKQSNEQAVASIRQSVDQVYDLNKWLLGSMAVGVLCLALSHFFRRKAD